jgi:enediyne biosynthesis protein E4
MTLPSMDRRQRLLPLLFLFPAVCSLLSFVSSSAKPLPAPLFRDAAAELGLRFQHFTGATGDLFMPEIMGAGAALFDYDGDGDLDVYLIQGTLLDKTKQKDALFPAPTTHWPGHRLFRNELVPTGRLGFRDVTQEAGVGYEGYGMGVAVGDYDNDGDPDLYVTHFGPNILFRNNGNGTFTDVTREAGVDDPRWSASAAFLDYDRDGDLDLFVTNYVDFTLKGNKKCYAPTGEPDYCTPAAYHPVPDRLFRNDGHGKFADVTQASGIGAAFGPGLGVACADFNSDGWTDIYVANDGAANLLWINKRNGTFEESALLAGAAYSMDGLARAGMGVAAGDFDNDGDADLLVTNLATEGSTLYRNHRGSFSDVTLEFGLARASFPFTGFGVGWFDYNNDGRLDLFAANGAVTIVEALRGSPYPYQQRNQLFRNDGNAKLLVDVSSAAGSAFEQLQVGRGAAFGDIDNDGDLDILISNNNGPVRLLLNEGGVKNHWLQVRLQGASGNRQGVGAKVAVLNKNETPLWRHAHTDGSYLSAHDSRVHFGLGSDPNLQGVLVHWPGGTHEVFEGIRPDTIVTLRQGTGKPYE